MADNGYEYAEIDGIRYDIKNGYATVAKFLGNKATANIRSEITISGKSYAVTSIRSDAFKNTRVTSIVLPNSITEIAADTFEGCSSLTSIVIPGSITSISAGTFEDCSALTSVKFEDTTTWYLSSNNQSTEIDVTNESDNARNLAKLYSNYTWIKR